MNENVLLRIRDLEVHYPIKVKTKGFMSETKYVKAVDGVSFDVLEGETFGIVGESGCGKTTTGKTIVRLLSPTRGSIAYQDKDIFQFISKKDSLEYARNVQIVFQDPYSSLDPRFTVGRCIGEPLVVHKVYSSVSARRERVLDLMHEVGLLDEQYTKYPHEFSGGQRQRIGVARALALNPSMLVCDEPVSALDVSIQAQILNLMQNLQKKFKLTYIFISHNLGVIRHMCDRVAVMYLGHIVELTDKRSLFTDARHPYTLALLDSIPDPNPEHPSMQEILEGDVPNPIDPPLGCCFHTRCKYTMPICTTETPPEREVSPGHTVACHLSIKSTVYK